MPLEDIAAAIITRDAEPTLAETLRSLRPLPEVIVYDNGSTDRTEEIARSFDNVRFFSGDFLGFGPTKNRAAELAERDWILSIDADESLTEGLVAEIGELDLSDGHTLFLVDRHNYFLGRRVRHAGWGDDWLPRLYHRSYHGYNAAPVHERIAPGPGSRKVKLSAPLRHEAVTRLGDFLQKVDRYSEIRASNPGRVHSPATIFLRASWAFFRTYFVRLGCLDGWRGLVISWSNANGVFFKYMKALAAARAGEGE